MSLKKPFSPLDTGMYCHRGVPTRAQIGLWFVKALDVIHKSGRKLASQQMPHAN